MGKSESKIVKIFFSPTGGTKKVVDMLAEALPGNSAEALPRNPAKAFPWNSAETLSQNPAELDLTDANEMYLSENISPNDLTLIAMPVYGGRAPVLAMERFRKIRGNGSRCLLIAVYGNRDYEDTLVEMQDAAAECGFLVTGAIAAVAEHSVVRKFAAGRPDEKDREDLHRAAENWLTMLGSGASSSAIPGKRPYTKPMSLSLVPRLTKACVKCGTCRARCPAAAIGENFIADKRKCISCMRCVSVCPSGARIPGQIMVGLSAAVLKKDCMERKSIKVYL